MTLVDDLLRLAGLAPSQPAEGAAGSEPQPEQPPPERPPRAQPRTVARRHVPRRAGAPTACAWPGCPNRAATGAPACPAHAPLFAGDHNPPRLWRCATCGQEVMTSWDLTTVPCWAPRCQHGRYTHA